MLHHLKISPHHHSGRLKPHEHTSYVPLGILTLITGFALMLATVASSSAQSPGPEAQSIGLTGTMPAPPPKTGPTITSPQSGQRFSSLPITVSGTCPAGTIVQLFKNNIFAGSTPCESNETYSIEIDLLFGENVLKAVAYDAINQASPDSNTVIVHYDTPLPQPAPSSFIDLTGAQLILNTDAAFRGIFPKQKFNMPITIIGGTPPYAINIQWGDGTNELISRSDSSVFNVSHDYKKPGTYKITLQASDSKKLTAFLTVVAIVNGQPDIIAASATSDKPSNKLMWLWLLLAIIIAMLSSFWLGEQREKKILLRAATKPQTPPFGVLHPPTS